MSVFDGDVCGFDVVLVVYEVVFDYGIYDFVSKFDCVCVMCVGLVCGWMLVDGEFMWLFVFGSVGVVFSLLWLWGGEWFECCDIWLLNYIIGLLGSGKMWFVFWLVEVLFGVVFVGFDWLDDDCVVVFDVLCVDL